MLKLYHDGAIGIAPPLGFATVKQSANQFIIRNIRFIEPVVIVSLAISPLQFQKNQKNSQKPFLFRLLGVLGIWGKSGVNMF